MVSIVGLVPLTVLILQGGWRGVAPSPTEEGALRAGHGEHGEPGHQEPHKDSYSTFASEFLESKHLSDDGKLLDPFRGNSLLFKENKNRNSGRRNETEHVQLSQKAFQHPGQLPAALTHASAHKHKADGLSFHFNSKFSLFIWRQVAISSQGTVQNIKK